jgi:hypothetical protein
VYAWDDFKGGLLISQSFRQQLQSKGIKSIECKYRSRGERENVELFFYSCYYKAKAKLLVAYLISELSVGIILAYTILLSEYHKSLSS